MFRCVLVAALTSLASSANAQTAPNRSPEPYVPIVFTNEEDLQRFLHEYDTIDYDNGGYDMVTPEPPFVAKPVEVGTPEHNTHIQNLFTVNGFKPRNLYLRSTKSNNPYIYFTNPIESRFPHPFAPLGHIKSILVSRIQLQKDIIEERNRDKLKFIPRNYMIRPKSNAPAADTRKQDGEVQKGSRRAMKMPESVEAKPRIVIPQKSYVDVQEQKYKLAMELDKEEPGLGERR